jgi:glutamate synthase (NADPH) small chain
LSISEEVALVMENRGILREDVQKAICHAETTEEKFINPSTGRSLASHRPGRVTFWVEYSRVGEEYQVHRAYSHRMEMKRGRGL